MSEQCQLLSKLSKSQKKKKAAQKKKLAKKANKESESQTASRRAEQARDEADGRVLDEFNDAAMGTREYQVLNLRGKLLSHPLHRFLEGVTNLRQSLGREVYPIRIHQAQRMHKFGLSHIPIAQWGVAMGPTASLLPLSKLFIDHKDSSKEGTRMLKTIEDDGEKAVFTESPPNERSLNAFADLNSGASLVMVWYPVFTICFGTGDKLACIALRDTCRGLRNCYTMFRNDTARLEQFVFNINSPPTTKRLEWVARRIEVLPSPPPTPPEMPFQASEQEPTAKGDPLLSRDPFRAPIVVKKRWSDYDDDDSSIGSPMTFPITPESSSDVPELDLAETSQRETRRVPTVLIAVPTLISLSGWVSDAKTLLPVPRISILMPEEYPRLQRCASLHPVKLQSSSSRAYPVTTNRRSRGRLEHWVREDVEKNLKAKLSLTPAARKKVDSESEIVIFNRMKAYSSITSTNSTYVGESDILGENMGISIDDIREIVCGRFKENDLQGSLKESGRVMLVPGTDGWICKHLGGKQI